MNKKRKLEEKERKLTGGSTHMTNYGGSGNTHNVIPDKPIVNSNPIPIPNLPISNAKNIKGL